MAKIIGKKATVFFEVSSKDNDEETERLIQQIISEKIGPILDKDIERLKNIVQIPVQPKVKKEDGPEKKYARENVETPELIPLGGQWAYSVAFVSDMNGDKAVRIAKGTIKGAFYRDKVSGKMVLNADDPKDPISLASKINIKRLSEWESLQQPVWKRLKALEAAKKEN